MDYLSNYYWKSLGNNWQDRALILMYHGTPRGKASSEYDITIHRFAQQMEMLSANGWSTITIRDLVKNNVLPKKTVAITFDDGYLNNYTEALPVLLQNNMVASWFIATDYIGEEATWLETSGSHKSMMGEIELRELEALGMEIGSHTCSHVDLSALSNYCADSELRNSRLFLEDLLGAEISSLAYPYGKHDERIIGITKEAGYSAACTTNPGWHGSKVNPLVLNRITVYDRDTNASLARKMTFADNEMSISRLLRYSVRSLIKRI